MQQIIAESLQSLEVEANLGFTSRYGAYPARDWLVNTGTGAGDNTILFTALAMQSYSKHVIHTTAGSVDVEVSVDGTNWTASGTSPMAMQDTHATASDTYVSAVPVGKVAILHGKYASIRLVQVGATAATATMGSYS